MNTEASNFSIFLHQVQNLHKTQKKLSDLNGENFNVFSILGMEGQEVKTHSAFLRELLDPKGTHAMGDHFLELFLQIPQIEGKLNATSSKVVAEYYVGRIDSEYSEGGFIDLLIEDKDKKRIIIENKIYAGDQKNQLLRYQRFDPSAELIYLTLDGHDASTESLGGEEIDYKPISYANEILNWLCDCRKEAVEKPVVREALSQYIELIRRLTNQTAKDAMKEEIQELLCKNPEFVSSAKATVEVWNSMVYNAKISVIEKLHEKLNSPVKLSDTIQIKIEIGEDREEFYVGYKLFDGESEINESELSKKLFDSIKDKLENTNANKNWMGWFNPKPLEKGKKFDTLPPEIITRLLGDESKDELDKFVQFILEQHETAINLMVKAFE
ncbi:PD-(D/E)XK nuclease family protein [Pontiellaceae bacterium B1224]|nr:PD-(D/E)XK nuclease family protein [Pontiellaceae bacterium B1224]